MHAACHKGGGLPGLQLAAARVDLSSVCIAQKYVGQYRPCTESAAAPSYGRFVHKCLCLCPAWAQCSCVAQLVACGLYGECFITGFQLRSSSCCGRRWPCHFCAHSLQGTFCAHTLHMAHYEQQTLRRSGPASIVFLLRLRTITLLICSCWVPQALASVQSRPAHDISRRGPCNRAVCDASIPPCCPPAPLCGSGAAQCQALCPCAPAIPHASSCPHHVNGRPVSSPSVLYNPFPF